MKGVSRWRSRDQGPIRRVERERDREGTRGSEERSCEARRRRDSSPDDGGPQIQDDDSIPPGANPPLQRELPLTLFCLTRTCAFAEWTFLLCILLFGGHALSFLFTRWSINFRSRTEATHVSLCDYSLP